MAELRVFMELAKLKSKGIIREFRQSAPFSEEDRKGIDFFIYPQKGKSILLQVKGYSKKGEKMSYQEEGIWYLFVPPQKSDGWVRKEILKIIKKANRRRRH